MNQKPFPSFAPHRLLRNGHLQTLVSHFYDGADVPYQATQHEVPLEDGDALVMHDDRPADWSRGDPVCLLIHGLSGSHASPYVVRTAHKFNQVGVRTFRLDLRGCGAGLGKAKQIYHAGRSEDAIAALYRIADECPGSSLSLVGFSLGGLLSIKVAAAAAHRRSIPLDRLATLCPPLNLMACQQLLRRRINAFYDRYFVRRLIRQVNESPMWHDDEFDPQTFKSIRRLWDFDEQFTSRRAGFSSARSYYQQVCPLNDLHKIRIPTLIIASQDDPVIPPEQFNGVPLSDSTRLVLSRHGGHLGFWSRNGGDPDNRWADWRIVEWVRGAYDEYFAVGQYRKESLRLLSGMPHTEATSDERRHSVILQN